MQHAVKSLGVTLYKNAIFDHDRPQSDETSGRASRERPGRFAELMGNTGLFNLIVYRRPLTYYPKQTDMPIILLQAK